MLNLTKTTIIVMFLVPLLVLLVKPLTLSPRFIQAATKAAVIVILMTVIVLVSLLLAFSVTNLPMILHRYQIKYKTFICAAAVTVLVYLLLLVCWLFLGGDWLLSIAYPIATLGLLIVWLGIVVIRCLPINGFFKSGILVLILGVVTAFVNPVIDVILDTSRPF